MAQVSQAYAARLRRQALYNLRVTFRTTCLFVRRASLATLGVILCLNSIMRSFQESCPSKMSPKLYFPVDGRIVKGKFWRVFQIGWVISGEKNRLAFR